MAQKHNIIIAKNIFSEFYYSPVYQYSILLAKGIPGMAEKNNYLYANLSEKYKVNILIPNYIGTYESKGSFTMQNCVKTLADSVTFLRGECAAFDIKEKVELKLISKEILMIGGSFGAVVVTNFKYFYPNINIKYVGLRSPLTDWKTQSSGHKHEENLDELDTFLQVDIAPQFRGYIGSDIQELIKKNNLLIKTFNPIDNINPLKGMKIFIVHGNKDSSIYWRKSKMFHDALVREGIDSQFKLLANAKHGQTIRRRGTAWLIEAFLGSLTAQIH